MRKELKTTDSLTICSNDEGEWKRLGKNES
jgi:hypothetical protein